MLLIKAGLKLAVLGIAVLVYHYLEYQARYTRPALRKT